MGVDRVSQRQQSNVFFEASKHGILTAVETLGNLEEFDVNQRDSSGLTAIYYAIINNHFNIVKALFLCGVDGNECSLSVLDRDPGTHQLLNWNEPPLVTAAKARNSKLIRLLLSFGVNPDAQSTGRSRNGKILQNQNALHFACSNADLESVNAPLLSNADVNTEDRNGNYPIHLASRLQKSSNATQIVRLLCEHGADVNIGNRHDIVPLYINSMYGCYDRIRVLLLYGATPDIVSTELSTPSPLHEATVNCKLHVARILVGYGAKLNVRNKENKAVLHESCRSANSRVSGLLLYHGIHVNIAHKAYCPTLLGFIINGVLNCEQLASLFVFSGYNLNNELWLEPPWYLHDDYCQQQTVTIGPGRVNKVCVWLRFMQRNVLELAELSRIAIRNQLSVCNGGRSIVRSITSLGLPISIRSFVQMNELFTSVGYDVDDFLSEE